MNVSGWLGLTESDGGAFDVAHLNLAVFYGRAPRDPQRDLEETTILQEWVELVRTGIANSFARHRNTAANLSDPEFAMLVMATVLHRNLQVAYHLSFNEGPYNASDPANLFLSGLLLQRRGSCVTMPLLTLAIGRRLGYPLHLVLTKRHAFCRWEDSAGVRFNIEAAKHGYGSHSDDYYCTWPAPFSEADIRSGVYLRNLTRHEETGFFFYQRGLWKLEEFAFDEAIQAFEMAGYFWAGLAAAQAERRNVELLAAIHRSRGDAPVDQPLDRTWVRSRLPQAVSDAEFAAACDDWDRIVANRQRSS